MYTLDSGCNLERFALAINSTINGFIVTGDKMTTSNITKATPQSANSLPVKITLLLTGTLTVMAGATIAPALPAINATFADVPNVDLLVRLVLTLPAFFIAVGAPLAGYVVDAFGRKRLLAFSVLLYAIGGGSGLIAESLTVLLIGRALLGIAVAGVMTTVTTLIADYFQGADRASFLGYQSAAAGLGGVLFLTLGGVLADVGWHYPFLIYLSAMAILPMVLFILYEPTRRKPVTQSEKASPNAKLPIGLLTFIYITMTLSQVVFYFIPVFLPFYLEDLLAASATQSGLAIAGLSLFFSIASWLFGRVVMRLGHIGTLLLALVMTGTAYILITLANSWLLIILALPLAGFGLGFIVPNLNVWLANSVAETVRGRALGGIATALFLGQFISPLIGQPIATQIGERMIYAVAGVFMLLVGIGIILSRKQLERLTVAPVQDS